MGPAAKIGLVTGLIALTEGLAIGRTFATLREYRVDGNKEMMSFGFMNICGSLASCYVTTGNDPYSSTPDYSPLNICFRILQS